MKYDIPDFELHENTSHTKVYNRVPEGSDVLEFGCATGYMTKAFRELKGCRVWCTEIDPEGAEAASQFAEEVLVGDVETYEWAERLAGMKFDRIIFADVLEHLRRPDLILTRAKEFLKPGGSIVVNSSIIERKVQRDDVKVVYCDANRIAESVKNPKGANVAILGAMMGADSESVSEEKMMEAIRIELGEKKARFLEGNKAALEAGIASAKA